MQFSGSDLNYFYRKSRLKKHFQETLKFMASWHSNWNEGIDNASCWNLPLPVLPRLLVFTCLFYPFEFIRKLTRQFKNVVAPLSASL